MNLNFNYGVAEQYKSPSQIARVLTENWVKTNCYCPKCGSDTINEYENNKPVADFFCEICSEDYELKSKDGKIGNKIVDGAYSTMIARIESINNPNFFFMTYNKNKLCVESFIIIPKHFFTTEIIERRKPLSEDAKRAGWIGCNINLSLIPDLGKVYLVKNSQIINKDDVISNYNKSTFLLNKSLSLRGWILDILICIDKIDKDTFTLKDVYRFEEYLKLKYPSNNFIKDKIRQQLQQLRDLNIIEFTSRGNYKKIRK